MFKKMMCLVISVTIATAITACGSAEKSADKANNSDGSGKTITISALSKDQYLESAIEMYKEVRPDITIDLKTYAASPDSLKVSSEPGDVSGSKSGTGNSGGKKKNTIIMGENNPKDVEKYVSTLNTEIMTGKGPDIISVDILPYRKYADKNLLADLSELIQTDKNFDISKYYQGILDAVKYKGNLYAFPVKFTLNMLNGDKTIFDDPAAGLDERKWTWQDFRTIAEKLIGNNSQQGMTALTNVSELELLNYVMGSNYDRFIDMEKKNADFNNPEFKEILNLCKELLDKKLVDTTTEKRMTARGNTLFHMSRVNMPMDFLMLPQMQFNGNGKLYRLPGNRESDGITFSSNAMFAINNNSSHKNEAWEFIKFLLSEEVQSRMELIGFPVNRKALEAIAAQSIDVPEKRKMKAMGPEGEIDLKPASKEDVEALVKTLEDVKRYDGADREILKIILDEADSFFKGRKSAEEVSELIQNRVNTYLKE